MNTIFVIEHTLEYPFSEDVDQEVIGVATTLDMARQLILDKIIRSAIYQNHKTNSFVIQEWEINSRKNTTNHYLCGSDLEKFMGEHL